MVKPQKNIQKAGFILPLAVFAVGIFTIITTVIAASVPSQVTVDNSPPTVNNVVLNGGSAITLTANSTTSIFVNFQVVDSNGCRDVFLSGNATGTTFRTGVGATCTADNLNCYIVTTTTNDCVAGATSANATMTVDIYYFAEATDASSSYSSEAWKALILVADGSGATGTSSSTIVELNSLTAINVQSSTIDYGTVSAGTNTGSTRQEVPFDNAGNTTTSIQLSGTAMTSGSNEIPTSSQRYATSSTAFNTNDFALSGTATAVSNTTITRPTSTNLVSLSIFWGLEVPNGTPTGTYTGTNTYTAVYQP